MSNKIFTTLFSLNFLGNQLQMQHQYQNIPNIHTGSIPATGMSSYSASSSFQPIPTNPIDKSVEDTRMIIEQSNRLMVKTNCGGMIDDKQIVIPATSYIDQPMLSAMQQMFNNTNGLHATGAAANHQNMKTHVYQPQQIYFN